ncbi:hypothetical protein K466DRAFT_585576 [Polyporus arcularius HHB13444]|uniref:Uncharacterized protein n=1 Tax=Polyporus arcularius HHB13444 TaxID=1314778 RepID=A0A5C3PGL3_9APHY|nr:hypothetical protein K466DRAFT_585576 [Polyporus arcularius HHB13444]
MAQNNPVLTMGLNALLQMIRDDQIDDNYFKWTEGVTAKSTPPVGYKVQGGYQFTFTKEGVSEASQMPPHIRYRLRSHSTGDSLSVYTEYANHPTVTIPAVRAATWAAFRALVDLPGDTFLMTRDARGYPPTGFH